MRELIISLSIFGGCWLIGGGLYSCYIQQRALNWPVAVARIMECHLDESAESGLLMRIARVRYDYEVSGKKFSGNQITFNYIKPTIDEAHNKIYKKLQSSPQVKVYYQPDKPSVSVLAPVVDIWNFFEIGTGIVCLIFGACLAFSSLCVSHNNSEIPERIQTISS